MSIRTDLLKCYHMTPDQASVIVAGLNGRDIQRALTVVNNLGGWEALEGRWPQIVKGAIKEEESGILNEGRKALVVGLSALARMRDIRLEPPDQHLPKIALVEEE